MFSELPDSSQSAADICRNTDILILPSLLDDCLWLAAIA